MPAVAKQHGHDQVEELVEPRDDLARARALSERGEPADVEEQDADLELLALEDRPLASTRSATPGSMKTPKASRRRSRSSSPATALLNARESGPISSVEMIGTRAVRSPAPTRSVASRRSRIGASTERDSSTVSSREIVKATAIAISTSTPRSSRCELELVERPATITPVMTLMTGSPARSFQRSGTPARPRRAPSGSARAISVSTGRMDSSMARKRSETP